MQENKTEEDKTGKTRKRRGRGRPRILSRESRSPETRLKLIDAATDSIIELGYARTSISEIVKRANVTKGTHVYLFENKLDLITLTVKHLFKRVRQKTARLTFDKAESPEDIETELQEIANAVLSKTGVALFEVWMASRTDPELRAAFKDIELKNEHRRSSALHAMFDEKTLESTDLYMLFEGLILFLRGLALQKVLDSQALESEVWLWWRKRLANEIYSSIR
jgi:AcrR family transcriptional regulator